MKFFAHHSINSILNVVFALLLVILFLALGYNNYRREQALIIRSAVDNANAISRQIIVTRDYLAKNVTTEVEHNYNLVPQVAATQIASQLTSGSRYYVRQVSLRYRNPKNRPDAFETAQLIAFRDVKAVETWRVTDNNREKELRYMLPMKADESCLACHGSYESAPRFVQLRFPKGHFSYGYKKGEVIGAVSVSIPLKELYRQVGVNLKHNIFFDGAVLVIFILVTGWIIRKIILEPVKNVSIRISEVARTGIFTERLSIAGTSEINELASSFNELMSELDRKTRQKAESEERYRNFIEIAQSPIISFMADGKIVISNQKAERLFGLGKQELLGLSFFDFLENGDVLRKAVQDYFSVKSSDLIGTTTRQTVRDICGRLFEVEIIISVSQSDQSQLFSAILRTLKDQNSGSNS